MAIRAEEVEEEEKEEKKEEKQEEGQRKKKKKHDVLKLEHGTVSLRNFQPQEVKLDS